jgi:hypothetical protein
MNVFLERARQLEIIPAFIAKMDFTLIKLSAYHLWFYNSATKYEYRSTRKWSRNHDLLAIGTGIDAAIPCLCQGSNSIKE